MKKIKYLIFLFIALVCVTGCGKDNTKKELKDAFLKMKDTKAVSMKMSINMGTEEVKIPYNVELAYKEGNMHAKIGVSFLGAEQTMEYYGLMTDDDYYMYMYDSESEMWAYTKGSSYGLNMFDLKSLLEGEDTEKLSDEEVSKNIDEFLDTFDSMKKVKSDKDGYKKYELTINKKKLEEKLVKEAENDDEKKEMEESLKSLPETLNFVIYVKDGEIAILSMDLSKIELPTEVMEGMNMKLFDFTVEILGRNDAVDVTIPKSVTENATYIEQPNIEQPNTDNEI